MADAKPVSCPKCHGTLFKVEQLSFQSQDYDSATGDWSCDYNHGHEDDYPQSATCKRCGLDVTDLLNARTIQFYGTPPERESERGEMPTHCTHCGGALSYSPSSTPGHPDWCHVCDRNMVPGEPQVEDDGERLECGGCGESFNTAESDASCVDTYCSAECEDDDTDEGCPYNDPDCTSRADECHDACERQPPVPDGKGGVL